jgi:hypothetical protein
MNLVCQTRTFHLLCLILAHVRATYNSGPRETRHARRRHPPVAPPSTTAPPCCHPAPVWPRQSATASHLGHAPPLYEPPSPHCYRDNDSLGGASAAHPSPSTLILRQIQTAATDLRSPRPGYLCFFYFLQGVELISDLVGIDCGFNAGIESSVDLQVDNSP